MPDYGKVVHKYSTERLLWIYFLGVDGLQTNLWGGPSRALASAEFGRDAIYP